MRIVRENVLAFKDAGTAERQRQKERGLQLDY